MTGFQALVIGRQWHRRSVLEQSGAGPFGILEMTQQGSGVGELKIMRRELPFGGSENTLLPISTTNWPCRGKAHRN